MRGFKHGVPGHVVDVAARRDADAAHLRRERIGNVVAVQVQRGNHVVLGRPRQDLLQERIRNHILDDQAIGELAPGPAVDLDAAKFALREVVAPVAKTPFGELHDVALVHQREALALVGDGVLERGADEPLAAFARHGLDAIRRTLGEPDFLRELGESIRQHRPELLRVVAPLFKLDAGVNVFGVFAEDHHVHQVGTFHGRFHAAEVAHGPQAHIKIEFLPERDVQRTDAAADGRRERSLDAHKILTEGREGGFGQPATRLLKCFFAGQHFLPRDGTRAAVRFGDCGIKYAHTGAPDVGAGAVTFNKRNDGIVGNVERVVRAGNCGGAHADLSGVLGHVPPTVEETLRDLHRIC